jgi:hypothetical protein
MHMGAGHPAKTVCQQPAKAKSQNMITSKARLVRGFLLAQSPVAEIIVMMLMMIMVLTRLRR